jgi:branched-chain amino acid aminotransferase
MNECFGKYYIFNGELKTSGTLNNNMIYEGESVYEVIRLIGRYPVFFTDHCGRLDNSRKLLKRDMLADNNTLKSDIQKLVDSEKAKDINIKIVFNYNRSESYLIYLIHSVYPTKRQYLNGVKGTFFEAERKDPEAKLISQRLRAETLDQLLMEGAYEAVLVNRNGFITEGSRSNIFLIKDDILYTAPDKSVLNGITRKHILEICREKGISVIYTLINRDELEYYQNIFMTGTSPGILPFSKIGDHSFNPNHRIIRILQDLYQKRVVESIKQFKNH